MTVAPRACQPERFAQPPVPRPNHRRRHARLTAMRTLALETATLAGSVALLEGGRVVGSSLLDIALTHSERLMAMVDRLLSDCGQDIARVDGLSVSIGPGSFTGLRVGVATAK